MPENEENRKPEKRTWKELTEFTFPADLKAMSVDDLKLLAVQIRAFLIQQVSRTGGHLASNLGIVEIAIGLHKVFQSPHDKMIWDTGHQAYVHKILTGRAGSFGTLRQAGGLSGFPKKKESEHDIYETGHSSTSLSAALGLATARDLQGDSYEVIAVTGDGSMTGGPALEALNNLGTSRRKVIVIFNDNGMSIAPNTGGLADHFAKLRTSRYYTSAKEKVKGTLGRFPESVSLLGKTKDRLKYAVLPDGIFFEELGITYLGPFNGHDMGEVIRVLAMAKKAKGPVLCHFITTKGKGYRPAEKNPDLFHGVGAFDPATGILPASSGEKYSDVFGQALLREAARDEKIVAITAAMCSGTGLSAFHTRYPDRFFDTGIAEAHSVLFAAGLASGGMRPVVAIYSSFLQRAYDEILEDICLQKLPVLFAIDRAGVVGDDGETHQGVFDLSYLMPMPGMTILAPADADQLRDMVAYAFSLHGPVAIRYPRGKVPACRLVEEPFRGNNIRICPGRDLDIFCVGPLLEEALQAADKAKVRGLDIGVCNIGMVKPFDPSVFADPARPILTLEDNIETGAFGQSLAARYPNRKIHWAAYPEKFIEQGTQQGLHHRYGLDAGGLLERIEQIIEKKA